MPGRTFNAGEYRFSYNTQESSEEIAPGHTTALFWEYDSRIGRRWNQDPVDFAEMSPYATNFNNPIFFSDPNGDCPPGMICDEATSPSGAQVDVPANSNATVVDGKTVGFDMGDDTYTWYDALYDKPGYYNTNGNRYLQNMDGRMSSGSRHENAAGSRAEELVESGFNVKLEKGNAFAPYDGVNLYTNGPSKMESFSPGDYPEVGTGESMVPVWGSGKQALYDFQDGNIGWGLFNTGMMISDVFMVKSLATGLMRGAWKSGSNSWGATRKWYGKSRGLPKNTQVHHVFLHRNQGIGKYVPNGIKNQPWNLKPILSSGMGTSQTIHLAVHGTSRKLSLNFAQKLYYGTSAGQKTVGMYGFSRGLNATR